MPTGLTMSVETAAKIAAFFGFYHLLVVTAITFRAGKRGPKNMLGQGL
jgi:hypothetical protein